MLSWRTTERLIGYALGTRVAITFSPSVVYFQGPVRNLSLEPELYLQDGIVLAVGRVGRIDREMSGVTRVEVYSGDALRSGREFDAFLRYGIACVARDPFVKSLFLKPWLTVSGVDSLKGLGVAWEDLRGALNECGSGYSRALP